MVAASTPPRKAVAYEIEVVDVPFLEHTGTTLLARLYKPRGKGPFPMMIDLHGGAWCNGDRTNDVRLCESMAQSGILVAAIDFRMPPVAAYPASLADINYAVRWLKANGRRHGGAGARVGLVGISSGGHQAMLAALRPADPRYSAIERPEVAGHDATVATVVLCWPVIDPLGRYRYAKRLIASGESYPQQMPAVLPSHDRFWGDEATMEEGSPIAALERGDVRHMPPVLYLQGDADKMHPRADLDRFVATYRRLGGSVELKLYSGEVEGFITREPRDPANRAAGTQAVIDFVHQTLA